MKKTPLSQLTTVSAGQAAPKDDEFSDHGIPFVRAGSLDSLLSGKAESDLELVGNNTAKLRKLKTYPKGTILFAKSGMSATKDRIYVLQNPAYVVSHLATLIPNDNAYADYLRLALKRFPPSVLIKDPAYPAISLGDIQCYEIPVPEQFNDQKRIAHLLGKVEGLIARRKEHLQQLDHLLKSVFLEMFGDPVRNEKGWEKKPLAQLGDLDRGVSKHRPRNAPELLGGKYPLIQTGDVSNSGTYIIRFTQTYSEIGLRQSKLWPAGTLCITIAANIAQTGILTFDACFPDSVVGFSAYESEANPLYVLGLFWFFQRILEKNAPAAAQKNINLKILRELEVPAPPTDLQNNFVAIVEIVESLKSRYQQSLTDLENLYGALSQKAFCGELDLSRVPVTLEQEESTDEIETESATVTETPVKPAIELPTPSAVDDLHDAKGRMEVISFWLDSYLEQLRGLSFSAQDFMESAQQKLWELLEDDAYQLSVAEYDHVKNLLFRAVETGRLVQSYIDDNNLVQIKAASGNIS